MQTAEVSKDVTSTQRVARRWSTRAAASSSGMMIVTSKRSAAKVMTKPVTDPYTPNRPLSTSE